MGPEELRAECASGDASLFLDILARAGHPVQQDDKILDFGCGRGGMTTALLERGLNAHGCDVVLEEESARLRRIETDPYRLPYPDASFDVLISAQVWEHVMDPEPVIAEVRRVLKPDGISLHAWPAKWRPIEGHVHVPFASVIRGYPWLGFWALLGIRNEYQRGMNWREVARRNQAYLMRETNYPDHRYMKRLFLKHFSEFRPVEAEFFSALAAAGSRKAKIAQKIPMTPQLYALLRGHVALLKP